MRTGRPRERAITLRDGFYIEIYNSADSKGLKLRSDTARQQWKLLPNNTPGLRK